MARGSWSIQSVLVVLTKDLEMLAGAATDKPSKYLGRTLARTAPGYEFGIGRAYVESWLDECNMMEQRD